MARACYFGGYYARWVMCCCLLSCLLITIIVLQESKGCHERIFRRKIRFIRYRKQKGFEVWVNYITAGLSIAFIVSLFFAFFVDRFPL